MITSFFAPKRRKSNCMDKDSDTTSTDISISHSSQSNSCASSSDEKTLTSPNTNATKRIKTVSPCGTNFMSLDNATTVSRLDDPVEELLLNLTDESWKKALANHFQKPSFSRLASFVAKERKNGVVYPPPEDTFTALNLVPLDKVKVVIVGQDPYHGPGQGHGLAFSVRKGVPIPPSLKNIYKELLDNDNCGLMKFPTHGNLERWARQGVLLLNTVLTVRRGEANSHKNRGWEELTDEIIRCLLTQSQSSKSSAIGSDGGSKGGGIVFLLWGNPASKKTESILKLYGGGSGAGAGGTGIPTVVLCSSHPSPLGASKTASPFLGSQCFKKANEALRDMGLLPIDWGVDGSLPVDEVVDILVANDGVVVGGEKKKPMDKKKVEKEIVVDI